MYRNWSNILYRDPHLKNKKSNQFVILAFDKTKDETEKERSEEDKVKKRKELNVLVPNSFTQEGTQLPATSSVNNMNSNAD